MSDNLHVKVTGNGDKRLILLHGLFGSAKNLGQLARAFKEGYTVYSVDLPDHGRSTWLPAASVAAYAEIVGQWLIYEGIGQALKSVGFKLLISAKIRSLILSDKFLAIVLEASSDHIKTDAPFTEESLKPSA